MKTTLFIPDKIKVGFQERNDTYTGKLGYVIMHDGKVWRKEHSWEGWRHTYISDEEYEIEKNKQYKSEEQRIHDGNNVSYYNELESKWESLTTIEELHNKIPFETFKPRLYNKSNDITIKPQELDNIPVSGFVLNKKAGGYRSGWNHRQAVCRVYDPRGFEFEISIENLLFILENTNSIKGKGLEGEFVYSWSGPNLVLLPVDTVDYDECMKFTKMQSNKFYKKDMIEGHIYEDNNRNKLVYIGHLKYINSRYSRVDGIIKKQYIFISINKINQLKDIDYLFENYTSLNKIKKQVSTECVPEYANIKQAFLESKYSEEGVKDIKLIPITLDMLSDWRNYSVPKLYDSSEKTFDLTIRYSNGYSYRHYDNVFYINNKETSKSDICSNYYVKEITFKNNNKLLQY